MMKKGNSIYTIYSQTDLYPFYYPIKNRDKDDPKKTEI